MARVFAVAHEGNPHIDSIKVPGGSLHDDAVRTVKQTGPPAPRPGSIPVTPLDGSPSGGAGDGSQVNCLNEDPCITITALGGKPPYSFTTTSGQLTDNGDGTATLCPPVNSGSAVAGNAWCIAGVFKGSLCFHLAVHEDYGCDDEVDEACSGVGFNDCVPGSPNSEDAAWCNPTACSVCNTTYAGLPQYTDACVGNRAEQQFVCDLRTGPMIADGCEPCGTWPGATVTITDSNDDSVAVEVTGMVNT